MLLLLFFLSVSSECGAQRYVYGGPLPYRRAPVRRSPMEALERLRTPVARYFPQVDTQAASAGYPGVYPGGYQLTPGDLYALPPQWTEDFVHQLPTLNDDDEVEDEYANYEYEVAPFNTVYRPPPPQYAEEIYPQQEPVPSEMEGGNLYNDLMTSYLMGMPQEVERQQPEEVFIQRRDGGATSTTSPPPTPAVTSPQAQAQPSAQVTAVPSSPEKKNVKSLIVPDPPAVSQESGDNGWRETGQKEEPLFRPLQTSQRTTWNAQQKSPIPLLKQMIQSQKSVDPLMEELSSLKKP